MKREVAESGPVVGADSNKDIEATQLHNNNNNNNNNNSSKNKNIIDNKHQNNVCKTMQEHTLALDGDNINSKNNQYNKMTYCLKNRWILLLSMALTFIIAAILVAMLTMSLLDSDDQCYNSFPFQQPSYKLFSTKTTYSTAYNYLNNSNDNNNKLSGSIKLPSIFSESDSLKTLNYRLTSSSSDLQCKVRQLHYFGRHAARFPSSDEIKNINEHLNNVKTRIDLSKFSPNNNGNGNGNVSSNNNNRSSNANASSTDVCFNPLAQYKQWLSFMAQEQGNLVMDSGAEETLAIAQRFKSIFPEMFDANRTKIEIGTTEELRTAQTALVFLKQIENFNLDFCNLDSTDRASKVDEQTNNQCYKLILEKYHKDKLMFHKRCELYHKEDVLISHNLNLKEPNRTKFISNSVSRKLKLPKEESLSSDETQAIYKICKYESAFTGSSIWCNLFSDIDLKFYEYMSDVDDFFNQAYGHPDQMRSACPVTTELMKSFKIALRASAQDSSRSQPEAHFYFTHSEVIQKILAASVDLEQDSEYSPNNILTHLQAGTVPESRQWQTSLFTPFSANLAFTLYECPRTGKSSASSSQSSPDEYLEFDASHSSFKVVASLNEKPILLDGCSGYICDLNDLLTDSRIDKEKRCKFDEICKRNIVVT